MELLVGRNAVREALAAGRRRVYEVLIGEGVEASGRITEMEELCRARQVPVVRVRKADLDRLGGALRHQGIAAQVSPYPYVDLSDLFAVAREREEPPFLLALDSLEDPQNVGALLRTAEAVGVHGVVLPERRAATITPAVGRSSAGAVEHLRVAMVTNLGRALETLKEGGLWIVAVEDHPAAQDYRTVDMRMPLALVVGSEGKGMRRLILEKSDFRVRIPMQGKISSLNVSVAGSILLYHVWSSRQGAP